MDKETISVLLKKLKGKQAESRKTKEIIERIKKAMKKDQKYREIRNKEESVKILNELKEKNQDEILEHIRCLKTSSSFK